VHWFARLRSTNDHAAALRRRNELFAPAIVLTGNQFKGRGRNANSWWSGPGSITVTFIVPIEARLSPHQLPLIAGLAVRDAVAEITADSGIELKWPNDLMYGTRKFAGLLCERVHRADLIGLGLNVNLDRNEAPAHLRNRITSLDQISGSRFDKTDVLLSILRHLHSKLSRRDEVPFASILTQYDRHHVLRGRRVTVSGTYDQTSLTGTCQGLDGLGRLIVRDGNRLVHVVAGQVQMR
jgi:BirA family biotin operon repressor/biotin-[acetyl-CoA-carboxylase] ligase